MYNSSSISNVGELDIQLESLNSEIEGYQFDSNQLDYIEETLQSEGINNVSDLQNSNIEEIVNKVDSRIKKSCPEIPSKIHMNYFGKESDVWKEFRKFLEPKCLEAPSDKIQQEQIASAMYDMEELRIDNWETLSIDEKISILQELENKIATIEHRNPTTISSEILDEEGLFGYQCGDKIVINEKLITASNTNPDIFDKMLETFIHEGRHAYQKYNIEERMVHPSKAQVDSWRENETELGYWNSNDRIEIPLIGGITYAPDSLEKLGFRLYYYQPQEIDARVFAADTMTEFHKQLNA